MVVVSYLILVYHCSCYYWSIHFFFDFFYRYLDGTTNHNDGKKENNLRNSKEENAMIEDEVLDCGKPVNFTIYDDLIGNETVRQKLNVV